MRYHQNTNKRHRLQLKNVGNNLHLRYRCGIPESRSYVETEKEQSPQSRETDVYSRERILTFLHGNDTAIVFENGSLLGPISPEVLEILKIPF